MAKQMQRHQRNQLDSIETENSNLSQVLERTQAEIVRLEDSYGQLECSKAAAIRRYQNAQDMHRDEVEHWKKLCKDQRMRLNDRERNNSTLLESLNGA